MEHVLKTQLVTMLSLVNRNGAVTVEHHQIVGAPDPSIERVHLLRLMMALHIGDRGLSRVEQRVTLNRTQLELCNGTVIE